MTLGLLFWIVFVVGLIFFGVDSWRSKIYSVPNFLFWVLIFLLGWGVFDFVVKR
jgi:hypothetical protein